MKVLKGIGGFFKKHLKLVIVLAIIAVIVGFIWHNAQVAKKAIEEAANEPVTSEIKKMDLQQSVAVTGTLKANNKATVTSTIGGTGVTGIKVSKINFEEGDYVNAGDVVVEFDGDDYNRKIAELNAQHNIENRQSEIDIADLQQKIKDAQTQLAKKQKYLDDNKYIYEDIKDAFQQYEKYRTDDVKKRWDEQSAIAAGRAEPVTIEIYEKTQDEIETLNLQIQTYQNQIELAQLKQNYAQTYTQVDAKDDVYESMEKTHVSAPISGYIITMNVDVGNNYTQGNTVFTIADTSGFVVDATVNEYDIANIAQGLPANIKFEATGDEEFGGEVTFVSIASEGSISGQNPQAAQGTSGVANYKIKIKLNDKDDRLRVGMTAKASVILDSVANVLSVPYDCIQQDDKGKDFVAVVKKDGTKKNVYVTTGLESDYYVEIKGEGLKEGMTVEAIVKDAPSTNIMDYMEISTEE
ncbi:MAG: efflux RND transporter periplasmic adaptor subunit [Pseudobutyrivibrio sp.]|uniref:efflux RND transporter periplasmic adaptor subunit n=1 Tax=Pseudobutyrivibrio sp. TaxID=2014367 RepID=UPI0025DBE4B3|nr:efflux RND transporter periplasmic adaptor subunit [Pseudobutyrivibrio sp.]MBQ8489613.1 efflux RND transporter periplasmic adaptor subunit [Pseudobutyrivibrio sp.]